LSGIRKGNWRSVNDVNPIEERERNARTQLLSNSGAATYSTSEDRGRWGVQGRLLNANYKRGQTIDAQESQHGTKEPT